MHRVIEWNVKSRLKHILIYEKCNITRKIAKKSKWEKFL